MISAAAAFFLVSLLRSFTWVKVKMIDGVKPFACDLCMSFWATAMVAGPFVRTWAAGAEALGAAGLCLLVLKVLARFPEPPPDGLL